jgi:hypothetical protein
MPEDNKIYYVGFSDGGYINGTHYSCMYDEDENVTKNWCEAVSKKFPDSNITYLKMSGKLYKDFTQIYREEFYRWKNEVERKEIESI